MFLFCFLLTERFHQDSERDWRNHTFFQAYYRVSINLGLSKVAGPWWEFNPRL